MKIISKIIAEEQNRINAKNRKRLLNDRPMILASNCTGGFLYHWLGLQFRSPFINLYMDPEDFIIAMENFSAFISTPITEVHDSQKNYPVGEGYNGTIVHFMHYHSFAEAIEKWEERIKRMDLSNTDKLGIILSNWGAMTPRS